MEWPAELIRRRRLCRLCRVLCRAAEPTAATDKTTTVLVWPVQPTTDGRLSQPTGEPTRWRLRLARFQAAKQSGEIRRQANAPDRSD